MPINYENTDIKGVSYNGTSIDKVIYNDVVVWEAWKPWSTSFRNPSSGWISWSPSQAYEYKIPDNVKVTYAWLRSATDGENTGTWVGIDGWDGSRWVEIVRVPQKNWDQECSASWPDGCPYTNLKFLMGGRSLKRYHNIKMNGFTK